MNIFVQITRPFVHRLARAYGLRIESGHNATGQNPLIFEDPDYKSKIPTSCLFNTRSGAIRVGQNVVFGEAVHVLTGKHISVEEAERAGIALHTVPESGRDVTIGDGVYVGSAAIIIGPVTIGPYAVIGAGSVVTKDVKGRTFVAGNPARLVRSFVQPSPKLNH